MFDHSIPIIIFAIHPHSNDRCSPRHRCHHHRQYHPHSHKNQSSHLHASLRRGIQNSASLMDAWEASHQGPSFFSFFWRTALRAKKRQFFPMSKLLPAKLAGRFAGCLRAVCGHLSARFRKACGQVCGLFAGCLRVPFREVPEGLRDNRGQVAGR